MRSILSVLGITMGVASLVAVFAIVNGEQKGILQRESQIWEGQVF